MTKVLVEGTGWLHHIALVDMFTREVVGHFEGMRARAVEWLQALDQAVLDRFPDGTRGPGLIVQADNGRQPTARAFRNALRVLGVQLAFIDLCEPKQNAIVERYFRTPAAGCSQCTVSGHGLDHVQACMNSSADDASTPLLIAKCLSEG